MDVPKARPDNERATPETKTPPASKGKPKKKKSTQYKQNGDLLPDLKDRLKIIRENRIGEENEKLAQIQENVPTPMPSGDEISPSEVQPDLREVLIEKRKRVNQARPSGVAPATEKEETKSNTTDKEPGPEEGELAPTPYPLQIESGEYSPNGDEITNVLGYEYGYEELSPKTWPRPWTAAEDPEFDHDRPLSPPSPINQTESVSQNQIMHSKQQF